METNAGGGRMILHGHIAIGLLVLVIAATAEAQSRLPNAILRVAVQQTEDGKVERGFHVFELFCWDGACSLTTLSLNQCGMSGSGKPAFAPKVRYSSMSANSLRVHNDGTTLVVQESGADVGGDYVTNLRFDYAQPRTTASLPDSSGSVEVSLKTPSFFDGR